MLYWYWVKKFSTFFIFVSNYKRFWSKFSSNIEEPAFFGWNKIVPAKAGIKQWQSLFSCFFLLFVYYISKGVIQQRTQNFLESPFFLPHLISRASGLPGEIWRWLWVYSIRLSRMRILIRQCYINFNRLMFVEILLVFFYK